LKNFVAKQSLELEFKSVFLKKVNPKSNVG